ncbi:Hsp70 family protein [Actinoplanes nipponensis]|nr:Hsp70 family protein [Actinoplanes nipponensis]
MQYGLGIDLGTTQTAAAVRVDGRTEVVRLGGRRAEIPSLVFVRPDGSLLIGEAAERRGQAEPGRLAREFKRRIGDPVPILAGGVPFSAHALTAKLLRHVLDAVTALQDGPPAVLTVTHPANWGPYKREQLDQALRLADTGPVLLRTEPEAAALQHATARRIGPGETVAVYDLGGGTFDAAVLRREDEGFQLLGEPDGIEQLGGADFDEAVFAHVLEVLGDRVEGLDPNEPEVVTALARLRRDCVEAKEALSFDTEVMIAVALPGVHTRIRLNRSELESMIAPALADTVAAMHRALRAAQVAPEELDAVLLAGGSSRIPLVGQLLSTAFDRPVVADPHPEHSIAMGAAVATALITGGESPFAEAVAPPPREVEGRRPAAGQRADTAGAAGADGTAGAGETEATTAIPAGGVDATAAAGINDSDTTTAAAIGHQDTTTAAGIGGARAAAVPATAATGALTTGDPVTPARSAAPAWPAESATAGPRGGPGPADRTAIEHDDPAATAPLHPPGHTAITAATAPGDAGTTRILPGAGPHADRPVSGGTVHGPAAPVAFTRGAASVPGSDSAAAPPTRTFPQPDAGRTLPPPAGGDRPRAGRRGLLLVLAGAVTLAVIAGTTLAIALTRGDDRKRQTGAAAPAASPSASAPAYPTARMLIQVDTGGAERPARKSGAFLLTPGRPGRTAVANTGGDVLPEWSRDRKRFAVIRYRPDGGNAIWVMDADGGNAVKVVDDATGGRVSWNQDGTRLAFLRRVGDSPQIFVIKIGEARATQLTRAPGKKDDPAWSPGGGAIAYWTLVDGQPQIFVLNANDPQEPGRQITEGDSGPGVDPNWAPDGMRIAYTHSTGDGTSDIWVVAPDGRDAKRVTDHEDREMDPSWSPDGTWLAFTRGPLEQPRIVITKADGSVEQTLTEGDAREGHACWS